MKKTNLFKSLLTLSVISSTLFSCSTTQSTLDLLPQNQVNSLSSNSASWGQKVSQLPQNKSSNKKVTLLSYLGFDNDKGGWREELQPMINLHEESGSNSNLNQVIQTDGEEDKDVKRYYITNDNNTNKISSKYTQFQTERNSSNYRSLQSFIRWGFSSYKSQVKILDINTHGAAFYGAITDDSTENMNIMSLPNISKAITNGVGKVDILTFDACLMAALEVAYELKDNANVLIGSEDSTMNTGMLYSRSLNQILAKSNNVTSIAKNIVLASDRRGKEVYTRINKKGKTPNVLTISAINTNYVAATVSSLDSLAKLFLRNMPKYKSALKVALDGTHPFYLDEDMTEGQRDLYEVLKRIETVITDQTVRQATNNVRKNLNKAIIISRSHKVEKYAQGMAINVSRFSVDEKQYQNTSFAKRTQWDEFIKAVYQR